VRFVHLLLETFRIFVVMSFLCRRINDQPEFVFPHFSSGRTFVKLSPHKCDLSMRAVRINLHSLADLKWVFPSVPGAPLQKELKSNMQLVSSYGHNLDMLIWPDVIYEVIRGGPLPFFSLLKIFST